METESMDNNKLLPLEQCHVVLGRYNNGKKIKALTHAVEAYKTVRRQIRRTKNLTRPEIFKIKFQTTALLQNELAFSQPPRISFWVDVNKAKAAGKLEELLAAHPQCRVIKDFDGEEVVFVQDNNDFFLQADIDNKRRKPTASFEDEEEKGRKVETFREVQHNSFVRKQSTGASVVSTCSTAPTMSTLGCSTASEQTMSNSQRFRLAASSMEPLEVEIESVCCNWIGEAPKSLATIKRKTRLVEIFKSYLSYYQRLLMGRNPFHNSQVPGLQEMNEEILVHITNTLGNSMVEWYGKHPSTCMPGEMNAWNDELGHDLNQPLQEGKCHCSQNWNSCDSLGTFQDSDIVMSDDGASPDSLRDWADLEICDDVFDCSGLPPDVSYVEREIRCGDDLSDIEAKRSIRISNRASDEVFIGGAVTGIPIGMQVGIEPDECDEDINELCDSSFFDECEPTTLIGAFHVDPFPVEAVPIEAPILVEGHLLLDSGEGFGLAQSCEAKQPPRGHLQHKRVCLSQKQRRSRSLEKARENSSRRSKRSKRFWVKSRSPSRFPTIQEQDAEDLSLVANEMELGDFCRRLRLNDPTIAQIRIDGDLARAKAMELEQAMECSLADWCLKPVWDRSTGRTEKPSYVMFQRTLQGSIFA